MSFTRKALSFAEGLVNYVLERYSVEKYKPIKPNFKLNRRVCTSGSVVDGGRSMFAPHVGMAVVALQPHFEKMLHQVEQALNERNTDYFEPLKFLEFCCLATLEMAHRYFDNANFSIPEYTTLCIAKLLLRYYREGSFKADWDWQRLSTTASSILSFERSIQNAAEFVPRSPPPYLEPASVQFLQSLPCPQPQSVHFPQYFQPAIPGPQQSMFYPQCLPPTMSYPQPVQQTELFQQCLPSAMPYTETGLYPQYHHQAFPTGLS